MSTFGYEWMGDWSAQSNDELLLGELEQTMMLVGAEQLAELALAQGSIVGGIGPIGNGSHISRNTRIAFKVKSETESLDDGFRWRKYGKKMVKNNPHPRNYYKCLREDCQVKKRVERDREDSEYVVVTYDGVHNHECSN